MDNIMKNYVDNMYEIEKDELFIYIYNITK